MALIDPALMKPTIFTALRTLILANLPTYTYNGATQTYTLKAAYSRENPDFSQIVLNESKVSIIPIQSDGTAMDYEVEVEIEFYAKELHGQKAIVTAQSQLSNTFVQNIPTFNETNGLLPMENFWDDSTISAFQDNNQVIHTGSSIVRFKAR